MIVTDEMVEAFGRAWADTPAGEPGDRRRAGLEAALVVQPSDLPISDEAPEWVAGCRQVLERVFLERVRQVAQYGDNHDLRDGTGPDVEWLAHCGINLDLRNASELETSFRREYETHPCPTWMHLVREEIAESFKESDPELLIAELSQVAALCVSWIEKLETIGATCPT